VLLVRLSLRSSVPLSGPARLRVALEELGGSFIKFGQMLALQPDILSLEYCNGLFDLLDRITPFDYTAVEQIFLTEIGKRPAEIFDSFAPEPVATASIGQVHVAYLDGRKVAVKVQRPNVETDFAGDIRLMAAAMMVIKRLHLRSLYWMLEPTGEFLRWTHEELDYRYEARYMERLRRNAANNSHERVPEVFWPYTTRRTLVCEFFEGDTMLSYLRALESGDEQLVDNQDGPPHHRQLSRRRLSARHVSRGPASGKPHDPARQYDRLHRLRHHGHDQSLFASQSHCAHARVYTGRS
jgi:ubiquinone biosynthesis protein